MNKVLVAIGVALVLVAIAYLAYGYLSSGQVNVYIQDPGGNQAASNSSYVRIYLTVTSIMLHKENATGNPWVTISNGTETVLLSGSPTFLASAKIPTGTYNEVRLVVSSAKVEIGGVNVSAALPSAVLKIPIVGSLKLSGGSNVNLIIELPGVHYADGEIMINPTAVAYVQS